MIPDLVPADDLLGAVSLSSAQFNLGRVIGPALAGVVLAGGLGGVGLRRERGVLRCRGGRAGGRPAPAPTSRGAGDDGTILRRIAEGARVAAAEPGCRSAIILIGIVALIGSPFIALVPAMAINGLARGAGGYTVLLTAQGIGAVGGALVLAPLARALGRRAPRRRAGGLSRWPSSATGWPRRCGRRRLAILVVGACYIGVLTGLNTVVQRRAPTEVRGRVLGLYMMVLGVIYPVGAVRRGCHRPCRRASAP